MLKLRQQFNDDVEQFYEGNQNNNNQENMPELFTAVMKGTSDSVRKSLRDARQEDLNRALVFAVNMNKEAKINILLAGGALPTAKDERGITALMYASQHGETSLVERLFKLGAAVNARAKDGMTALMWASKRGHLDVVKTLWKLGADVMAVDIDGLTALSHADDTAVQNFLLKKTPIQGGGKRKQTRKASRRKRGNKARVTRALFR
jgi:ankyrin repeat protein